MRGNVTVINSVSRAVMASLGLCLGDRFEERKINKKGDPRRLLETPALRDLDQPLQLIF